MVLGRFNIDVCRDFYINILSNEALSGEKLFDSYGLTPNSTLKAIYFDI
jgi:hypothetical protein